MRVDQLRHLIAIVEYGSFRLAADALHISQPALSESIKRLERELGASLMDRGRGGARLTRLGDAVMPRIRALLEAEGNLKNEIDDYYGLRKGEVRIGAVNAASNYILGPVLAEFHSSYPNVQLRVTESGTFDIVTAVCSGDVEIGIVVESDSIPTDSMLLESEPLLRAPYVVCVSNSHPLTGQNLVAPGDVAAEPLILFRSGYFMSKLMASILGTDELNVVYHTNNTSSAKRMIAAGVGLTVLPGFSVKPTLVDEAQDVDYIPLDSDHPHPRLVLIKRNGTVASPAVRDLWEALNMQAAKAQHILDSEY